MPRPRPRHDIAIDDALEEIDRFWIKDGVPEVERIARVDELRAHLENAAAEGYPPEEVLGPDPVGFAAEWTAADRRHPWLGSLLLFMSMLCGVAGGLMLVRLVAPWGEEPAFPWHDLGFAVLAAALATGGALIRRYRGRLGPLRAAVLTGLGLVAAAAGYLMIAIGLGGVTAQPTWPLGLGLLAAGVSLALIDDRMRRTARTRHGREVS
ncbi:DUF1048 domain-containing protein [Actinotalea sp. K2]|uniref:DUF1048 domain-containing protein n=1 Tax=Actinotalea sp. K2 TaxID=2939438 RepID=UPI002017EF51|nr:DUF1048 domain-containing protein [Actinotalea sp. K2]MCL3860981.1 DUF1048 domain-containing protein [Actinotalea sp. K2]